MPHLIRKLTPADEAAFLKHMESAQTPPKIRAIRTAIVQLELVFGGITTLEKKSNYVTKFIARLATSLPELSDIQVSEMEVLRELRWLRDHPGERPKYGS